MAPRPQNNRTRTPRNPAGAGNQGGGNANAGGNPPRQPRNPQPDPCVDPAVALAARTMAAGQQVYTQLEEAHTNQAVAAGASLIAAGLVTTRNRQSGPIALDTDAVMQILGGQPTPATEPTQVMPAQPAQPQVDTHTQEARGSRWSRLFARWGVAALVAIGVFLLTWLLVAANADDATGDGDFADYWWAHMLIALIIAAGVFFIVQYVMRDRGPTVVRHEHELHRPALPAPTPAPPPPPVTVVAQTP